MSSPVRLIYQHSCIVDANFRPSRLPFVNVGSLLHQVEEVAHEATRAYQCHHESVRPAPPVRRGTKGAQLQSGKYYNIRSYTMERFLDVANGATREGNEIIGWERNGGINQLVSLQSDYY